MYNFTNNLLESPMVVNAFNKAVGRAKTAGLIDKALKARGLQSGINKNPLLSLRDDLATVTQIQNNRNNLAQQIRIQRADDARRVRYQRQMGLQSVPKTNKVLVQRAADNMSGAHHLRSNGLNPNGDTVHMYAL